MGTLITSYDPPKKTERDDKLFEEQDEEEGHSRGTVIEEVVRPPMEAMEQHDFFGHAQRGHYQVSRIS